MITKLEARLFKLAVGEENIGKESDYDIEARCPICGDSKKNKSKKRLHLYNKGTEISLVHCYNGDCSVNHNMYSFLRDFYPDLFTQYKRDQFKNNIQKLSNNSGDVFSNFSKPEPKKIEKEVLTQDLTMYFTDIKEAPEALEYIRNRGIEYNENHYGKWYFGHQDLKIGDKLYKLTNCLIIPLYYNGEMYGFYSRNIKDKQFYTYMHDANVGYKLWNWFNIDKNSPTYIFEGIFDALSSGLPNVIAAIGAKIPEDRIKELKNPIFCYDNDKTGLMNALKMSKLGYKVFIQPNNITEKDMNEVMLKHPELRISQMINNNLYSGIGAEIKIKAKL